MRGWFDNYERCIEERNQLRVTASALLEAIDRDFIRLPDFKSSLAWRTGGAYLGAEREALRNALKGPK